jgi:hypothetical protein
VIGPSPIEIIDEIPVVESSSSETSSSIDIEIEQQTATLTLEPVSATDFALTDTAEFKIVTGIPAPTEGIENDGTLDPAIASEEILKAVLTDDTLIEAALTTIAGPDQARVLADEATMIDPLLIDAIRNDVALNLAPDAPNEVIESDATADILEDAFETYIDAGAVRDDTYVMAPTVSSSASAETITAEPLLRVTLRDPAGIETIPEYYFKPGSVILAIEPPQAFVPGTYTLTIVVHDPVSGDAKNFSQDFGWGVLALNADQDVYRPDQSARMNIGVLDSYGMPVCDPQELTLTLTSPTGQAEVFRLSDGGITATNQCHILDSMNTEPDFFARTLLREIGVYTYTLEATTLDGTRSIRGDIVVDPDVPVTITRVAATRLYPAGFSPMSIIVNFHEEFTGTITEIVPVGFALRNTSMYGDVQTFLDEQHIVWNGRFGAGESVMLTYEYDAPDVSPYFYLLGPLTLEGRF